MADGAESCALDVAARGEHGNAAVGKMLGITGQRARQLAVRGGLKLLVRSAAEDVHEELRLLLARHGVTMEVEILEGDTDAVTWVVTCDIPKMGPVTNGCSAGVDVSGVKIRRRAT